MMWRSWFLAICFVSRALASEYLYSVEFHDADIRAAVRMLAKLGGQNIVVPESVEGKVTASFEQVKLEEALGAILKTHGFGFVVEEGTLLVVSKKEVEALGEDLMSASFNLQYAKAKDVLPHLQSFITERGTTIADERTNSVYVRDTSLAVENIRKLVSNLDREDRQVLIEAKIVDASVDFIRSFGIQWGVTHSGGDADVGGLSAVGTSDAGRNLGVNLPAEGLNSGSPLGGLGLIIGNVDSTIADLQLSAAEEKGDIKILSRPSVATLNNHSAKIRSGVKFYVVTSAAITVGQTGDSSTNLQQIGTGIELQVTPQISVNDLIKLEIEAVESEADFSRAVEGIPAVIDSTATTTVMLKNGDTTIIGGLYRVRETEAERGIPGLMRIPLLGYLFKSDTKTQQKSELLIFITPKIIEKPIEELPHFSEPGSAYHSPP
ncbi:MAG: hypothetical protein HY538_08905 [Deltaproteobacteria bacterium]|nr:hypothetical protein [Deltaproteobacteria bacterium]